MDVNLHAVDKLPLITYTMLAMEKANNNCYKKRFMGEISVRMFLLVVGSNSFTLKMYCTPKFKTVLES